jgi:nucleolar protein 15
MNNYILFEKILKCSYVEDKKKYDRIFLKWKKKFEFKERYKIQCEKMKKKNKEEIKTMIQGLLDREEQRREKMKELGIKYEYKGFKEIVDEYKKENKSIINKKNDIRKKNKKEEDSDKSDKEESEEIEMENEEIEDNNEQEEEEEEKEIKKKSKSEKNKKIES